MVFDDCQGLLFLLHAPCLFGRSCGVVGDGIGFAEWSRVYIGITQDC